METNPLTKISLQEGLSYNTELPRITFKEYGRNITAIVQQMMNLKSPEKRRRACFDIIEYMICLQPLVKNTDDYRNKLWDYLYIMTDYKLDIPNPPFPPPTQPAPENDQTLNTPKTNPLPYPQNTIRDKHYGKNLENLIEKAKKETPYKKYQLSKIIAACMKAINKNSGRDTDDNIKDELYNLSHGELDLRGQDNIRPEGPLAAGNMLPLERNKKRKKMQQQMIQQNQQNNNNIKNKPPLQQPRKK